MTHTIRPISHTVLLILIFFQTTLVAAAAPKSVYMVRVLVAGNEKVLGVTIKGAYRLWALPSKQLL